MNKNTVQLETYPDMFIDDNNELVENPKYDDQVRVFWIDEVWFYEYLLKMFRDTYTWDETWHVYEEAKRCHAVLHETIEGR